MGNPLFPIYKKLWRDIQDDDRIWTVMYSTDAGWCEEGSFAHEVDGKEQPQITIYRTSVVDPPYEPTECLGDGTPADIKRELFTLAHEYGHALSWTDCTEFGSEWPSYYEALQHQAQIGQDRDLLSSGLSREEKRLIIDEERRASRLGRPFVPEGLRAEYDESMRLAVHEHRYRLGMEEQRAANS